jgi:hypothetical protein
MNSKLQKAWAGAVMTIVTTITFSAEAIPVNYQITPEGVRLENVSPNCPLIYDNDWWFDTPDKNYLWAKATLGQADLRGSIVTRDLWNWENGYQFTLKAGMEDAEKSISIARRSGLRNIPDAVAGADKAFARPASSKIEDTPIVASVGSSLIVQEARKASPQKPLLIFVGGPLNTVANAYLIDPSIANKIVVFMTDLRGYNGKDAWANYIVASRCRLINYGAHIWWPQRPSAPVMPLESFTVLPKNPMTDDVFRIAKWFWERSTKAKPDRDDGFADGAPLFLVFNPKTWKRVQKQSVNAVFGLVDVDTETYDVLDAREVDYQLMSEEFFKTLADQAVYQAPTTAP